MISMYDIGNTVYFLDCDRPVKGVIRAISIEAQDVVEVTYKIMASSGVTYNVSEQKIFMSANRALVALKTVHAFELKQLKEEQAAELEEFKKVMED